MKQLQSYFSSIRIAKEPTLDFLVALTIIVCVNVDSNHYIGLLMQLSQEDQEALESVVSDSLALYPQSTHSDHHAEESPDKQAHSEQSEDLVQQLQNQVCHLEDRVSELQETIQQQEEAKAELQAEADTLRQQAEEQSKQLKRAEQRQQELKELYQSQFRQREQLLKEECDFQLQQREQQFFDEVKLMKSQEAQLRQQLGRQDDHAQSLQESLHQAQQQLQQLQLYRKKAEQTDDLRAALDDSLLQQSDLQS